MFIVTYSRPKVATNRKRFNRIGKRMVQPHCVTYSGTETGLTMYMQQQG